MTRLRRLSVAVAFSALCALPAIAGEHNSESIVVKVVALHPFTHFAYIPEGLDLSSIRFEGVKMVKVATQRKSTIDVRFCDEASTRDPGGSMRCPDTQLASPEPAYQVTYSYRQQPLASDEYGSGYSTFSVYLRPDELSPAVYQELSQHKIAKDDAAGFFELHTYRAPVRKVVVDEAASTFCPGYFVDGLWTRTDPKCADRIRNKTVTAASNYVTVEVDPALPSSRAKSAANAGSRF